MRSGIYKILNKINDKFYIGSAINLDERFREHNAKLSSGKHINTKLQAAWNKYGHKAFEFQILEYCNKEKLITLEQFYFDWFSPHYNILKVAGSSTGYKHTEEFKNNRSLAYTGRKLSEEQKAKISTSLKGKKKSETHSENIRLAKLGNKYNLGKKHTQEARQKMSKNRKKNVDNTNIALYGNQIIVGEQNGR